MMSDKEMKMKTREYTIRLMDMMDQGVLDPRVVAEMALMWMSERDVKEMYIQGGGYVEFDYAEEV